MENSDGVIDDMRRVLGTAESGSNCIREARVFQAKPSEEAFDGGWIGDTDCDF